MSTFRRTLVTSALPYANGRIHIGHLAGAYLPADIYVRYLRMRGEDVLFICGSDEHGVPITLRALEEGTTPQEVIDRFHGENEAAFRAVGIELRHLRPHLLARASPADGQEFFRRLEASGYIEKRTIQQYYLREAARCSCPTATSRARCPKLRQPRTRAATSATPAAPRYEVTELVDPRSAVPGDGRPRCCARRALVPAARPLPGAGWPPGSTAKSDWRRQHARHGARLAARGAARALRHPRHRVGRHDPARGPRAREGKRIYVWFDAPIGYVSNTRVWAERRGEPDAWRALLEGPGVAHRPLHRQGQHPLPRDHLPGDADGAGRLHAARRRAWRTSS